MFVDDDPDHLLICDLIFTQSGYEVLGLLGCVEMKEMTDAVRKFKPHLIFMDHQMSGLCGADITRMLKEDPAFQLIPIIYFSAETSIEVLAKQAGANGWIKKPFEADSLLQLTADHLGQTVGEG